MRRALLLSVAVVAGAALASCTEPGGGTPPIVLTGPTMGTTYTITLVELPPHATEAHVQARVDDLLAGVNARMSTYDAASEVSRFNASTSTEWVAISPETLAVVEEAERVSVLTGGAFDITVGPVVDLWGFGPTRNAGAIPDDRVIARTLESVGHRWIHTRPEPPAIRKARPEVRIDLSAIAKGYAVDRVAAYLASVGVSDFLVEVGGETRARGRSPRGARWKIGIEKPLALGRVVHRVVVLENQALATSGDYRNSFEHDGEVYSHMIDPRTGRPVKNTLASVSVLAESSMHADALATGLMILGLEAARALAEREKLAVLFIVRRGDAFREEATAAMAPALAP